jgi:hypothetical protein
MDDFLKVKDRTFKFKVPSAWDGAAIFNYLASYDMPFGASFVVGVDAGKKPLPPEELEKLMKLSLKYCYEDLPGNPAPVVDEEGNVGIINGDAPLLTKIAVQYLLFFMDWWKAASL